MADWSQFRDTPIETQSPPHDVDNISKDRWAEFRNSPVEPELNVGRAFEEAGLLPGIYNPKGAQAFIKGAVQAIPGYKYIEKKLGTPSVEQIKVAEGYEPFETAGNVGGVGVSAYPLARGVSAVTAPLAALPGISLFQSGLIGGLYKSLAVGLNEERMPSEEEVRNEVALWAGGDLLFKGLSPIGKRIASWFTKNPQTAAPVSKKAIPFSGTTQTPYEVSKAGVEALEKPVEAAKPGPFQEIRTTQPQKPESLKGRVKPGGRKFGIDIRTIPRHPNTEQSVLQAFPYQVHSSRNGGELATNLIRAADEAEDAIVNAAYKKSRELNKGVVAPDQQLANRMQERIAMIDDTLLPTNVQEGLRRDAQEIFDSLIGTEERFVLNNENLLVKQKVAKAEPISNQQLIDVVQNLHHKMKFEYEHGEATNIYNLLVKDVEEALERRALLSGDQGAVQANRTARESYAKWAEEFNTPAARRFRNLNKEDYKARFNFLKNHDNFNELRPILQRTKEGRELIGAVQADIVEKELGQFMKNPRQLTQRELERKLRELGDVLTEEQVEHIRGVFNRERATFNRRVREQPTLAKLEKQKEALTKKAAKDTGIEPEDFWKEMDRRSGIQKIRNDLKNKPNEYNAIRNVKAREIAYGGKTTPGTGREMADRLRTSKNKDLWIELYSEQEYNDFVKALDSLGNKEARWEFIKKALVKAGVATGVVSKYALLLL